MKLVYHKGNNVGDAINPIVFEYFLGKDFFDGDDAVHLVGIGSILGLKRGLAGRKIVFSSGWGDDVGTYGSLPELDSNWDIRAVRGPLTAAALCLPKSIALVDGAYLVVDRWPRCIKAVPGRVGFIPHCKSLDFYPFWDKVCARAGLSFLDVRLEPSQFLEQLWQCEIVLSEAMHGAIFADAYGIPWVPIRLYEHISEFKWRDWWASLGMNPVSHYCPAKLHSVSFFSELVTNRGIPSFIAKPAANLVLLHRKALAISWLRRVKREHSYLSDRSQLHVLVGELKTRLHRFKEEYSEAGH